MWILSFLVDLLVWLFVDVLWWQVGYVVGRYILALVAFGKIQPGRLESVGYNWLGYKRDGMGRLEIDSTLVAGIGLITGCVGVAVILYLIH